MQNSIMYTYDTDSNEDEAQSIYACVCNVCLCVPHTPQMHARVCVCIDVLCALSIAASAWYVQRPSSCNWKLCVCIPAASRLTIRIETRKHFQPKQQQQRQNRTKYVCNKSDTTTTTSNPNENQPSIAYVVLFRRPVVFCRLPTTKLALLSIP